MKNQTFDDLVKNETTLQGVFLAFDTVLSSTNSFGVEKTQGISIAAARKQANAKALEVLNRVHSPEQLTEEDIRALKAYTGEGGIGGSTSEYYTPPFLAAATWEQLASYGVTSGNVCEPSCGTGVFNGTKPNKGFRITGSEVSKVSSKINQLLHPEDQINNMPFEQLAKQTPNGHFDAFVGNVPFGNSRSEYASIDPEYKNVKTIEEYFVLRAIDLVKPEGYITLVVPTQIVDSAKLTKFRRKVAIKAEFLGAHRIPSGTFEASGSADVVTDLIVLRRHSDEMADKIKDAKRETLIESNVLWSEFILGKYFKGEGRKFIHGDVVAGAGNWGTDLVKIPNLPKVEEGQSRLTDAQQKQKQETIASHNQGIAKKLSNKFDSRIDWELLQVSEPKVVNYVDGDRRMINGRWHELVDGDWELVSLQDEKGNFDDTIYGAKSLDAIRESVSNATSALNLKFKHLTAIHDTLRDQCSTDVVQIYKMAQEVPAEHRERVVRGALIGRLIQDYLHDFERGSANQSDLVVIRKLLQQVYDEMGTSLNVKGIGKLKGEWSSLYHLFANAMDKKGEFSDLVSGKLKRERILVHDTTNPEHVVEKLSLEGFSGKTSLDDFKSMYTGELAFASDSELLDKLSTYTNIAITPEGELSSFDRSTTGKIAPKRAALRKALASDEFSPAVKRNFEQQLAAINKRRKWSDAKRINFGMRARWIPRQLVKEFLHENGYNQFKYVSISKDQFNNIVEDDTYGQPDGIFTGYYTRNGKRVSSSDKDKQFAAQLEKYLNGFEVQSKDNQASSKYRDRIRRLEKSFQRWIRQHDAIDEVVTSYNDTFNGDIPFEHLDTDLGLENVSGEIVLSPYQNSEIRRLSEDGSGINAFGTGLGKTYTALGLVAYDHQNKRSRRACITVPKAVIEKTIGDTVRFYGEGNLSKILFVGFDLVRDKDGQLQTKPVLDDNGEEKLNPVTGNSLTMPVLRERTSEEIIKRMHEIPHSDINLVIMTKEQFAKIPLKHQTLLDNANEHIEAHQSAGLIEVYAESYRAQAKKESLVNALLDDGTAKAEDYPYMEDLNFDKVIADEGHNYRNSQDAGKQSRKLMYMAAGNEAQIAADMRQKLHYLKRKNNGRGAVLLTATPTPNSPVDAYNMLSHVMQPSDWHKLGIVNQDDFIQEFGQVEEVMVNRLNGETVMAQGLTGFKNLDALRSLFHRYINKKSAKDVSSNVKLPDIEEKVQAVEMSNEQKTAYELLRFRAELITQKARGEDPYLLRSDKEVALIEQLEAMYPNDQLFSVIRDMDRVTTDIELYKKQMTFIFSKKNAKKAQALIDDLPKEKTIKVKDRNEVGDVVTKSVKHNLNAKVKIDSSGQFIVTINEKFETELLKALKKHKLSQKDINHPLSPKYAQMIEDVKEALENNGKVLIFSEEKTQHKKLHRILSHHLALEPEQVGILNGDTVAGQESSINDENFRKSKKRKGDAKNELDEEAGLEAIAANYNSGKLKALIVNKKGEVGVDLHIGTSDVLHLTLPWNPASVDQRTGRGARVGSPQDKMNSRFYVAKGSFDIFRKDTIDRKRSWQNELFDGDAVEMANGEAETELDAGALLAANPEEYKAKQREAQRQLELKMEAEAKEDAQIAFTRYLKASVLANTNIEVAESREQTLSEQYLSQKAAEDKFMIQVNQAKKAWQDAKTDENLSKDKVEELRATYNYMASKALTYAEGVSKAKKALATHRKHLEHIARAKNVLKSLRPELENAIDKKLINVDHHALTNPHEFAMEGDVIYKVGGYHKIERGNYTNDAIVKLTSIDSEKGMCEFELVVGSFYRNTLDLKSLGEQVSYNEDELSKMAELTKASLNSINQIVTKSELIEALRMGYVNKSISMYLHSDFSSVSVRDIKEEQLVDIIYPDPNDKKLKEQLAKTYIARLNDKKGTIHLNELAEALFGEQFMSEMSRYDANSASDEDIEQWMEQKANKVEEFYLLGLNDATRSENKSAYASRMRDMMFRVMRWSPDTLDRPRYESAIRDKFDSLAERFESDYASYFKTMTDLHSKVITNALADSAADIRSRLMSLGKGVLRRNYSDRASFEELLGNTVYDNVIMLTADLISCGYETSYIEGTNYALTESQLSRAFSSLWSSMKYRQEKLNRFIVDNAPKVEVTTSSTTPSNVSDEDIAQVDYHNELAQLGIQVKRNSQPVSFKSRRGKVFRSEDEYSLVGLFDPKGMAGELFANKEALKRECKAMYNVDLSDEFAGSWWFIPSTITKEQVLSAFGL